VAEGPAEYQTKKKSRKATKSEYYTSRKWTSL
jgi:TfoX/Sxy family transcriptional regulator of competence genes